jgi:outer membrane protein assembly factor BamB
MNTNTIRLYMATAIISMLALACSSLVQHNPATPITAAQVRWTLKLAPSPLYSFTPVAVDDAIFAADSAGNIYKIDASDGSIISHFSTHTPLMSGIAISNDSIFVTTATGYLRALNRATGVLLWQKKLSTISLEPPLIADKVVLVKSNDDTLVAYLISTGDIAWVYWQTHPTLSLRTVHTFAIFSNQVVAVGLPLSKLVLLNLITGLPIWDQSLVNIQGATDLEKISDISVYPQIHDKTICVAGYNAAIACIDALSGAIVWKKPFSTVANLAIDDNNLYALDQDSVLYALNIMHGTLVWRNAHYHDLSAPIINGNDIIASDSAGIVHIFSNVDGNERSSVDSHTAYNTVIKALSDRLLLQAPNGLLTLINL